MNQVLKTFWGKVMKMNGTYVSISSSALNKKFNVLGYIASKVPYDFYIERAVVNGRVVWFLIGGDAVPYIVSMKEKLAEKGFKVRLVEK